MDNILFKPKQASLDDKNRIVIILQLVSLDTVRVSLYFAWIAASSPWPYTIHLWYFTVQQMLVFLERKKFAVPVYNFELLLAQVVLLAFSLFIISLWVLWFPLRRIKTDFASSCTAYTHPVQQLPHRLRLIRRKIDHALRRLFFLKFTRLLIPFHLFAWKNDLFFLLIHWNGSNLGLTIVKT